MLFGKVDLAGVVAAGVPFANAVAKAHTKKEPFQSLNAIFSSSARA